MFVLPTMCKEIKEKFLKKKKITKGIIHSKPNSKGPKHGLQEQPGTMLWHHLQDAIMGCHVCVFIGLYNYAVRPKFIFRMEGRGTDCACIPTGAWLQRTTLSHAPRDADLRLPSLHRSTHQFLPWIFRFILWVFHLTCTPACHVQAWSPQQSAEDFKSPGTGVMDSGELPCQCWESNLYPLQGEVFLILWIIFPVHESISLRQPDSLFLFPLLPTSLCFLFLGNLSIPCK